MSVWTKTRTIYRLARANPRGWPSFVWNTGLAQMRRVGPLMAPVHVSIEPTNACNARCPVCETGKDEMHRRKGLLDKQAYEQFVDDICGTTNSLMYYFMGEPFLNKHAYDMIRYARERGIYVETCTNGDFVDAKGVIYSAINKLSFQLGGMTEASHRRYRVASSLEKAHKNLYELIEERRKRPESNLQIEVGFIVMRHNEHEVPEFLRWAEEIGVDIANVVDPCVRNMLEGYAYLPKDRKYWYYDEAAFEQGILKPKVVPDNDCVWIWNSIQVNWNGDAVPCCRDPNGLHVLGNVFEEGLMRVFNGARAREFRRRILTDQGSIDLCRLCSGYGMPTLVKRQPASFSVVHHTASEEKSLAVAQAADEAVSGRLSRPPKAEIR
ncbi:MAG: radical SAM protein [Gammaproteobacteria bacterium]|nr:radical SAM protein [Gammaproteobacteria bacterium]